MRRVWVELLVGALAVLLVDQLAKTWALVALTDALDHRGVGSVFLEAPPEPGFDGLRFRPTDVRIFAGGAVQLRYVENAAAAFGLFRQVPASTRLPLFFAVSLGALGLVLVTVRRLRGVRAERFARMGFPLVLGGALGNVTDRVLRGFVIDFIELHLGAGVSWPAFNLADGAIVLGLAGLMVDAVVRRER